MPTNENGSRSWLADEVRAQREDITDLVKAVAGLQAIVKEMVEDSREERKSAKAYRDDIRNQLYAQRSEQSQLTMGLTDVQTKVTTISKTLGEHETERSEDRGAWKLATASARVAWTLFGVVGAAAVGLFAWVIKFAPSGSPPPSLPLP